jgi:hypothetical protein
MPAILTAVITLAGTIKPALDAVALMVKTRCQARSPMCVSHCGTAVVSGFNLVAAMIQTALDAVATIGGSGTTDAGQTC